MDRLSALFELLADEDPAIIQQTLLALLEYDEETLAEVLPKWQESSNANIRKHIHQLEAIRIMRRRRHEFAQMLTEADADLIHGLIDIHMLWFDCDSRESIFQLYAEAAAEAAKYELSTPAKLCEFMIDKEYTSINPADEIIFAENYCLGPVLESRHATGLVMCILAQAFAARDSLQLHIARRPGSFVLVSDNGVVIDPYFWRISELTTPETTLFMANNQILRYLIQTMFIHAIETGSFRYIHTIACAITGKPDTAVSDFLPYPYNGAPPQ